MKRYVCLGLSVLLCSATAFAVERVWVGASGANWTDEGVWTTNGVPSGAPENTDTVTISSGATVNLAGPALADTNRFAQVQLSGNARGTLVVGPGAYLPTVALDLSRSGTGPLTPGRLVIDGGHVNASGAQTVGTDSVNNPGRLEVLNGGSYSNVSTAVVGFRLYSGSVLVSNATFNAAFTTYIHGSSTTNVFEIVDGTVSLTAFAIGRDVNNASGKACRNVVRMRSGLLRTTSDLEIGHTGLASAVITGAVEQTGGTVFSASGNVRLPISSTAAGEYLLDGGLFSIQNTSDSFFLGGRDGAAKGLFRMTDGVFTNRGQTLLGSYSGGSGSVVVAGGTAVFERSLLVGAVANSFGDLALSGGTLFFPASAANLNLGAASNALGRGLISGGFVSAAGRSLNIGSAACGRGVLVLTGGVVSNSSTVVGAASAASGALVVSNGLLAVAGGLTVGQTNNTGLCEVSGGALTMTGWTTLGGQNAGSGTFVMKGGAVTNTGFSVGNTLGATGDFQMDGGAIYSTGDFYVGHGAVNAGAVATFAMTGGKILTTGRWIVGSYGTGYATVSGGEIEALRTGGTDQSMEVGRDPGSFGQLVMTGGALKGTNELVLARDGGSTGLVYVAGGDLYFNAIRRANGRHALNLAGGTLHPYNRDPSFAFSANLTNDIGYGETGTRFGLCSIDKDGVERTMHATCTFAGNGGLAKRCAGTVTLGGSLAYTGDTVVEAGTLALSNAVASLASGAIEVQAGATLDVSVLRATPFLVVSNQTLTGAGTVAGPVRLAGGSVVSGGSAGAPAVLTIDGDLTLDAGSTLLFNMLGGTYSRVHVTGNLTLPAAANLIVNGAATTDAQGRAMLTWGGALIHPSFTRWAVTGEKDPIAVLNVGEKSLTLSYIKGTLIQVL